MITKVYRYGCKIPSKDIQRQVEAQLLLAHQYRFKLWQLACAARALYRERRRAHFPLIAELEAQYAELDEMSRVRDGNKEVRKKAREHRGRVLRELREEVARAKADLNFKVLTDQDKTAEMTLRRALRKVFSRVLGLYSGTYQCVEDADTRARTGSRDPARPVWRREGVLGIQLQGGRTKVQVESGMDPSIHLIPPQRLPGMGRQKGARTTIRYRVRSDHRGRAVTVDLPAMVDGNELPKDARVMWAKLAVRYSGLRPIYSVQLTVQSESNGRQEFGGGEVAICFAESCITYAGEGEVARTFMYDCRLERVAGLQSTRDKLRNAFLSELEVWADPLGGYAPLLAALEGKHKSVWRRLSFARHPETGWQWYALESHRGERSSCQRSVRFFEFLKSVVILPEELLEKGDAWVKKENHLYQWQSDMRTNALLGRRDAYRVLAAQLRRKYRTILIDNRRLDAPKRKTSEHNALAIDSLRGILRNSFSKENVVAVSADSCEEMFSAWRKKELPAGEWSVAAHKSREMEEGVASP